MATEESEHFIASVARAAGDDEIEMRVDTIHSTARKIEAGEAVRGGGALRERFGDKSVRAWRK
jgi:hypothetical protein